jgi:hypothetical protein
MLGPSYLASSPAAAPCLPGFFRATYPLLVFFLTTLLLFTGIFAQFIWEEKALTEAVA